MVVPSGAMILDEAMSKQLEKFYKVSVLIGVPEQGATRVVSWIPFLGGLLPDETQRMRIRLKVAVVGVQTGQWEMFLPGPF